MSAPSSDLDGLEERTSTKFNAKDADLKLISKDKVVFRAHRLYLEAASPVFKAMFEVCRATGGAQLPSIDLEETTAVLEIGLPYVYPGRVDPFKLSRSRKDDWDVISMFDKYEIARGLEAVLTAFIQRDLLSSDGEKSAEDLSTVFTLASHIGNLEIRDFTIKRILELDLTVTALRKPLTEAASRLPASATSCGQLYNLLDLRKLRLEEHREEAGVALIRSLLHIKSPSGADEKLRVVLAAMELWERSSQTRCTTSLRKLKEENEDLFNKAMGASGYSMPSHPFKDAWQDLCRTTAGLPETLSD